MIAFRLLLKHGASVECPGMSFLIHVLFLAYLCDIFFLILDVEGKTPLHWAASSGGAAEARYVLYFQRKSTNFENNIYLSSQEEEEAQPLRQVRRPRQDGQGPDGLGSERAQLAGLRGEAGAALRYTRKWSVGNHMMGSGKWRLRTHNVCLCSFPCVAVADSDAAVVKALLKSEKCQINALDSNYRYDAVSIL